MPSVGGLLLWKDEKNYLRFEKGMHLKDEVGLSGNVNGEYNYFGRGILASEIVYLRIERMGDRISAYCSEDGTNWLICGVVGATHASPLQFNDPIQVGIHAIIGGVGLRGGRMDTATRFDYFKVMR